ncbi:MAG: hypothetical protein JSV23_05915 [Promethearchaeota archaeon]|nr:MAG: hypothetical protein JSV23_05915 [Candidatus Lokiarchaeota archaeon]
MYQKNTPVIVGAAQVTQQKDAATPLDPLNLIAEACQNALSNAGIEGLQDIIDTIYMSTIASWIYEDAPSKLNDILGIKPSQRYTAPISGITPQLLVNKAAKVISLGESNAILIAGGEASYSRYRANKGEITLDWPRLSPNARSKARKAIDFHLSQFERHYKLTIPPYPYALIETALRAASGRDLKEHLDHIGKCYERFSIIASENPYAWEKNQFSSEEIITPSLENRVICHPYTKRMVSNLYVDQAAALVMTTKDIAKKLGIDREIWVYPMGGIDLKNIFYLSQRPILYDSPAIREGSRLVLDQAGLKLEEIDVFDLYSCFPCMVEIARKEIGIPENDPRDLTITGGLSFFGGPFSSYAMHPIVTAVNLIQNNPTMKIMILANGGYNTSESFGIYGNKPPAKSWQENEYYEIQQRIEAKTMPEPVEKANGNLIIEAYTIIYDRNGLPERGVVMGRLESGERTLANIDADPDIFMKLEQQELVGQTFMVKYDTEANYNKLIF